MTTSKNDPMVSHKAKYQKGEICGCASRNGSPLFSLVPISPRPRSLHHPTHPGGGIQPGKDMKHNKAGAYRASIAQHETYEVRSYARTQACRRKEGPSASPRHRPCASCDHPPHTQMAVDEAQGCHAAAAPLAHADGPPPPAAGSRRHGRRRPLDHARHLGR